MIKKQNMIVYVGYIIFLLLIVLAVIIINQHITAKNEAEAYAVKMKFFTAEQTVEEYFHWVDEHNSDRLNQLFLDEGTYTCDNVEYIRASNIRESSVPLSAYEKGECPPSWEKKKILATVDFKYADNSEETVGQGWGFLLTRENSDSPWLIVSYYTKG